MSTETSPTALLERRATKAWKAYADAQVARLEAQIEHIKRPSTRTLQALEVARVEERRKRHSFIKVSDELRSLVKGAGARQAAA